MTHDQEREDLAALVLSPGWLRVKQWATTDLHARMTQATEGAANLTDDLAALNQLRQVIAAKRAVEVVLNWPAERVAKLTTAAEPEREPALSRGGVR
jgi:hypothetical protein